MVLAISARNTKVYKICKLCKAIFSVFYNISQPNFAILLILECAVVIYLTSFEIISLGNCLLYLIFLIAPCYIVLGEIKLKHSTNVIISPPWAPATYVFGFASLVTNRNNSCNIGSKFKMVDPFYTNFVDLLMKGVFASNKQPNNLREKQSFVELQKPSRN